MSKFPSKPAKGSPAIPALKKAVDQIIDFLPSLQVVGDNKTTSVSHSVNGTTIHAKQNFSTTPGEKSLYYAGSGLLLSGDIFNVDIDNNTLQFVGNKLSCTVQASGGGGNPTNGRFNTIGAGNSVNSTLSGCGVVGANRGLVMIDPPPNYYITINETPSGGYNFLSCDLTDLRQLFNYDLVVDSQDPIGYVNTDHYTDAGDFFLNSNTGNKGLGTQINLYRHSIGNTVIDPQTGEQHLVNPIMGLKVDLTVSGGTWIGTSAIPRQIVGFDVDPQELEINCLLTGTYDHSPHTRGFIDIVPKIMEDGQTWGVISTNLHAGNGIAIDQQTGEISVTGGGGGDSPTNGRFNTIGTGNSVNSTLSGCGIVAANLGLNMVDPPPNYYITINETPSAGYNLISCNLTHLTQLYNYDLVADSQAEIGSVNTDHYIDAGDLFLNSETGHKGLGTQISLFRHSIGNTVIDPQTGEQHLVNPIMGLKVDLTVSGGNFIGVSAVPRQIAGFDIDPQELEINCLLTGTYNHSPHTSGFIDIVPVEMEDGQTWGVISTCLHAGSGIYIDPTNGEISVTGAIQPGPTPTPTGGMNIVYITTEDEHTVVPNTKYCLIPITSLSTNAITYPNMDPTSISSFATDNNERIYKYFFTGFQGSRPEYLYETTSASIDGEVQYGAYDPKNGNWINYMEVSNQFGNIFILEPQQQDCVVEIDCGIGGNAIVMAPSGLLYSTFSTDIISGTPQSWYEAWSTDTWPPQKANGYLHNWRLELAKGNQYMFIYDHRTNMWNMIIA